MTEANGDFEALLQYIKSERSFDFTGYKRPSLVRRVEKRMGEVGCESYADYLSLLEAQPQEYGDLFNTILINVTAFFRDPPVWDYVRSEIVPRILEAKDAGEPIRIWSTGSASGEEAYTAAMVLAEALDGQAFKDRVKVYGTDVDEDALATARRGMYKEETLEPVPEPLREKYFQRAEDGVLAVKTDLRRAVIFGRHDLLKDPPISRIDLLLARNTLIYFTAATQETILRNFRFSLGRNGFLLLGRSEAVAGRSTLFEPVDLKNRVFTPIARTGDFRNHLLELVHREGGAEADEGPAQLAERLRETAFELAPIAHLVVQSDGRLSFANARARHLFGLSTRDLKRPFADLETSYRPLELRSLIDQAHEQRRAVVVDEVQWPLGNEERFYDVHVLPMLGLRGIVGTSITFTDISRYKHAQHESEVVQEQLAAALEQTQSSAEELETTNEELQSTNEELETTNEELQSTNEELETMNGELQATNEELEALNDELSTRTSDLDRSNALMASVLAQIRIAVIVVDDQMTVEAWSDRAEDLWGLAAAKAVGRNLMVLEVGFPLDELREPLRRCFAGEAEEQLNADVVNRLGREITIRVTCAPLQGIDQAGAIVVMEEVERQ